MVCRLKERILLRDQVWLTAIQSNKFKTGCFSLNFLRPLRRSEAAVNALIPSILLGGTQRHPDIRSISIRLDELYGASVGTLIRKKGEIQSVGLYADFVEDALAGEPVFAPLSDFVSELLFAPITENGGFSPSVYEIERENLVNAMRASLNNKQSYANLQLLKTMYAEEPYGIPYQGEEADLAETNAVSAYRQYLRLLSESRIEIFYLGRSAPQEAAGIFQKMLAALPRSSVAELSPVTQRQAASLRRFEQSMPLEQSKLAIGCRAARAAAPYELARMLVFAVLYGGGSCSRLFAKVREEKSLCYSVGSVYDKYKGALRINSGISEENEEAAKQEIYRQLSVCQDGGFSEEELQTAKRLLLSQLRSDLDSPSRLDEFYLGQAILGRHEGIPELIEAVGRVSAQDVMAAAASVQPDTEFFLRGVGQ